MKRIVDCGKLRLLTNLYTRDGVVRGVRLRAGKSFMERPIQFLYPLELHCDRESNQETVPLNPAAKEIKPKRRAAVDARKNIELIYDQEEEEL
jgi:hypothetical protein